MTMINKETINTTSNPNLLANSDFRNPVNLSGKTEWLAVEGPITMGPPVTIQGWLRRSDTTTIRVLEDCVHIEYGALKTGAENPDTNVAMQQLLDMEIIKGKEVTLSFEVKSIKGTWRAGIYGNTGRKYFAGMVTNEQGYPMLIKITEPGYHQITFKVKEDLSTFNSVILGFHTNTHEYNAAVGDFIELSWCKLELGDKATPLVQKNGRQKLLDTDQIALFGGGVQFDPKDDLNFFTAIGNYYCHNASIAKSLLNKPIDLAEPFTMQVKMGTGKVDYGSETNYFIQKIETVSNKKYTRIFSIESGEYVFQNWTSDSSLPIGTVIFSVDDLSARDDSWIALDGRWVNKAKYPGLENVLPFGTCVQVQDTSVTWLGAEESLNFNSGGAILTFNKKATMRGPMYISPDETEMFLILKTAHNNVANKRAILRTTNSGKNWKLTVLTSNLDANSTDATSASSYYFYHNKLFSVATTKNGRYIENGYFDKRTNEHNITYANGDDYDFSSNVSAEILDAAFCLHNNYLLMQTSNGKVLLRTSTGIATPYKKITLPSNINIANVSTICGTGAKGRYIFFPTTEGNSLYITAYDEETEAFTKVNVGSTSNTLLKDAINNIMSFHDSETDTYYVINFNDKAKRYTMSNAVDDSVYYEIRSFVGRNPSKLSLVKISSFTRPANLNLTDKSNVDYEIIENNENYWKLATKWTAIPFIIISKKTKEIAPFFGFLPHYFNQPIYGTAISKKTKKLYGIRIGTAANYIQTRAFSLPIHPIETEIAVPRGSFSIQNMKNFAPPLYFSDYAPARDKNANYFIKGR